MKATGIVRRIDELGRVVIPKEIRRTQRQHRTDDDRHGEKQRAVCGRADDGIRNPQRADDGERGAVLPSGGRNAGGLRLQKCVRHISARPV